MACGSSTSSSDRTSTAAAKAPAAAQTPSSTAPHATTPGASSAAVPTAASGAATVTAKDFSFSPDKLAAREGRTLNVTFQNNGSVSHTFTVYTDEGFKTPLSGADSGSVVAGTNRTVAVAIPADSGDLYFRCEIHPSAMKGEISVD